MREEQLRHIFDLLHPVSGVDFGLYAQPTIQRRLLARMASHRMVEVDAYISFLHASSDEVCSLCDDLLIQVTRFFREPESFAALSCDVVPKLLENRGQAPLRVWVPGCATGEEAYSLAIVLAESLHRDQSNTPVEIVATDVSEPALAHARAGAYPSAIAADVGRGRLRNFFTRSGSDYRVIPSIREMCAFARHDLTRDAPLTNLDLIMCRNVLIYLDTTPQKHALALFHHALNARGYLVLGQSETVGADINLFSLIHRRGRVHRKKPTEPGRDHPAIT